MKGIRNVLRRLSGGVVSQAEHEVAQERIRELFSLSANLQAEVMDKAQQISDNQVVIEAYQEDLKQTSAEVVRLRAALSRVKTERAEWRDRALGYREKMGMQKRRARG
jgi:chromosome segregation ATPase